MGPTLAIHLAPHLERLDREVQGGKMIALELDGTSYTIRWAHFPDGFSLIEGEEIPVKGTTCSIFEGDLEYPTWTGEAHLHPKDRYVKEKGRKISLSKALSKWPREKREEVWKAYFGRKRD
jgi:hypothetical protein